MMVDRYDGYELTKCSNGGIVLYEDYQKLENQLADLKERLRWIPVTERLPNKEKTAFYEIKMPVTRDIFVMMYNGWRVDAVLPFFFDHDGIRCYIDSVESWREIPELEDGE